MLKYLPYIDANVEDLTGKIVVITGANSGIGFSATRYLAYKHAKVVMACRNEEKVQKAIKKIKSDVPYADLEYIYYNQASVLDIESFANELEKRHPRIDAFVLNAGVYHPKRGSMTKDGLPLTVGTNFFGIYYLVHCLKTYLLKSEGVRLIMVGSILHIMGKTKKIREYIRKERKSTVHQYCVSKKMLQTFEHALSQEFQNQVIVTSMHPGVAATGIITEKNSAYPKFIASIGNQFLRLFANNSDKASLGIVLLVGKKDIKDGDYLVPRGLGHLVGFPKKVKMPKSDGDEKELIEEAELAVDEIKKRLND